MGADQVRDKLERLHGACFAFRQGLETLEGINRELVWDDNHADEASTTPEERALVRQQVNLLLGCVSAVSSAQVEEVRESLITIDEILGIPVDDRGEL